MNNFKPNGSPNESEDLIFELGPFPMWIFDMETLNFLKVNTEAIRQYGYSQKEFLSMNLKDIRPEEDVPRLEKAIQEMATREGLYKESIFRHKKKDGTVFPVRLKSNLITYNGRNCEIVSAIDISEEVEYQDYLLRQKQIVGAISDINSILLKNIDSLKALKLCFRIVSETLEVDSVYFFEINLKEQTASHKLTWTNAERKSMLENPKFKNIALSEVPDILLCLKKGQKYEAHVANMEESATKAFLTAMKLKSILALPVMAGSDLYGFIGIDDCKQERVWNAEDFQLLDVLSTNLANHIARTEALRKLEESEYKFKTMVQRGKGLIAIVDSGINYKYVAPNSKTVLGICAQDFIGKNAFDFINEEDIPRLQEYLPRALNEKHVSIPPYRFKDSEGNWRWIETVLTNHLSDPIIAGIVANTNEVTEEMEKKMARDLLYSLSKAIVQPGKLSDCLNSAMEILVASTHICAGEIWLKTNDGTRLILRGKAFQSTAINKFYQEDCVVDIVGKGVGLAGNVWTTESICLWENLKDSSDCVRQKGAEMASLNSAMGIPIFYNNEFLGCILLLSQHPKSFLSNMQYLLKDLGEEMGAVVKQRITEDEYHNFFDISPDPFCIIGFDSRLKKVNKALLEALDYREEDVVGATYEQFINSEDLGLVAENLPSLMQNLSAESVEVRMVTAQKEEKWFVWSGTVKKDEKLIIAVAKDITEKKLARITLKSAYERLQYAQSIAKLGYFRRNIESDIQQWTDEVYKIFGYTPKNFVPSFENVKNCLHPDDQHIMEGDPILNMVPGKLYSFDHRIITPTGKIKWVHEEIQVKLNEQGERSHIEGTVQDITESKEFEQQLVLSNERFRLAMLASNEMIWEIDHQKNIMVRSNAEESDMEPSNNEPFNKDNSWFKKVHPEDREGVVDSLYKSLGDKDKDSWEHEYRIVLEDGSVAYMVDRCFILRDNLGAPVRSVGSVMDVTTSRQYLEKIKEHNKNLREIAWLQSHVVRAPLARIMGLIHLYKEYDGGELTVEELFDLISTSAHELDEVIHEISDKTNNIKVKEAMNASDR